MRYSVLCLLPALAGMLWAQQPALIYTNLPSDVPPEVRSGRAFVPVRVISEQFGARVGWLPAERVVLIQRANQPDIRLAINSTTAWVDGRAVTLDAAPYISRRRTMVPLRFISEQYGVPVSYDQATRTVRLQRADRLYVLPLPSTHSGIVIATPPPDTLQRNPVLVQGVANVYEGALTIEVRDSGGLLLGRTFTTAGMGGFYAFSVPVYYNLPSDDPSNGRIVVFSANGQGDGRVLARDAVIIRLASTI